MEQKTGQNKAKRTYNTRDSLVVTDPTTSLAVAGLSMGEQTGSRIFQCLWSYVEIEREKTGLRGGSEEVYGLFDGKGLVDMHMEEERVGSSTIFHNFEPNVSIN